MGSEEESVSKLDHRRSLQTDEAFRQDWEDAAEVLVLEVPRLSQVEVHEEEQCS
jgi:hypothetical protein